MPLLAFGGAIPELTERSKHPQCTSYYCIDSSTTLVCCSAVAANISETKAGCTECMVLAFFGGVFVRILFCQTQQLISRVDDNNNSRGTCDPSSIYCCDAFLSPVSSF